MQIDNATKIHVGRRVAFWGGMGGGDSEGVIFAVHGEPNPEPKQTIAKGMGRIIHSNDCHVDVVLFNGRISRGINQCGLDSVGIGYKLLDRVHGAGLIEAALRNAAKVATEKQLAEHKANDDFKEAEAAREVVDPPVFYWNGIKDAKGDKLQKASYSMGGNYGGKYPDNTITVYGRNYKRFSRKVRDNFPVENDSDSMTDYFEQDRFRVIPEHPLYPLVKAALEACKGYYERKAAKRNA